MSQCRFAGKRNGKNKEDGDTPPPDPPTSKDTLRPDTKWIIVALIVLLGVLSLGALASSAWFLTSGNSTVSSTSSPEELPDVTMDDIYPDAQLIQHQHEVLNSSSGGSLFSQGSEWFTEADFK